MKHISLGGKKYPLVHLEWVDIVGDSTTVGTEDFNDLVCAHIVTIGYLYGSFRRKGKEYIRTFASYEPGEKPAFGDRNVYPLSVFTPASKKTIRKALTFQKEGTS
tara:strand:+ start:5367 stop:5681 length:315 start_codon:yes stop_codon:yes gene_type:complete